MLTGTILKGRYRLYDQLATGGSATVYLARDTVVGRIVVVKVIHDHMIERRFLARFVREIKVLKEANSPHIVKIYDYGLDHVQDDLPVPVSFIAMAYVEGLTLANIVRRLNVLSDENALALGRQIALALAELHRLGIVHRDLKAQNVMVTAQDIAKIIDFGIARNLNEDTLTGTNVFAGTLAYASPEQLRDSRSVDIRSDLYSLGVIMAECMSGALPPRGRVGQHMLPDGIAAEPEPGQRASSAREVVTRLLALDPNDRYQHPNALIADLDVLLAGVSLALPWHELGVDDIPTPQVPAPAVRLSYALVTTHGETLPLTGAEIVVGRSTPDDASAAVDLDVEKLGLANARTVSRCHCRLFRDKAGGYRIADLDSFNGTWINGERLSAQDQPLLADGDHVHVGGELFVFQAVPDTDSGGDGAE